MKILHVINSLDPAKGGPSVSVPSLAAAQAKLGHEVTIAFHQSVKRPYSFETTLANIPFSQEIKFIEIPKQLPVDVFFKKEVISLLGNLIKKSDVIHLQGIWDPIIIQSARMAMDQKKRYVFSPRGMLDPWSLSQSYWRKKIALLLIVKRLLNNCSFIHALNPTECELILPLQLNCQIKIFPNGVFPEKIKTVQNFDSFYLKIPKLRNRPFILFLSRLHYKKGLDILIEAFSKVVQKNEEIDLVIAGPDDGEQTNVETKIKNLNITDRVHLVGPLYGEAKFQALSCAEYFVLPSRQEGFSMAITEAMLYGLPVVISENCNFPEVAENKAGVITSLNADDFSNGIISVLESPIVRKDMSKAAKRLVVSKFSWHDIAEKILSEY